VFADAFGTEWYIEHDARPPVRDGWLFPPMSSPEPPIPER
jgi:hypothetical protein